MHRLMWLLGIEWRGSALVEATLPFGLHSALIFTALAETLQWPLNKIYLDDFITVGVPRSIECASNIVM